MEFNTEAGMEWDFGDEVVPEESREAILEFFLAHIGRVVAADQGEPI